MNSRMGRWAWCVGFVFCGFALPGDAIAPAQAGEAAAPKAGAAQEPAKADAAKAGDEGKSPAKPAGQPKAPAAAEKPYVAPPPATGRPMAGTRPGPFRPLSPGALRSVDPMSEVDETVSRHDVVELLAVDSKLDYAKGVPFRRDIWALEFKFMPIRMINVDLPQPSGFMQRKQIWYLIYTVTNRGKTMHPVQAEDGTYSIEYVDKPIHFVPALLLHSIQLDKWYPDRVIPAAMGPIRMRQDPNRVFYNTIEMVRDIQVGETVWGVATWEDIDPRTDRFSIYVSGLTNAYRWSDKPGAFKPGDPLGKGRNLQKKTLKLNFWRPGDAIAPKEKEIRFGIPGELDYEWVYR
jgi:hypothetical protein